MLRDGIVGLGALALLGGRAASQQARDVETLGFLGDGCPLLRAGRAGEALLVYRNPNADWAACGKIKLDPVTIWAAEGSAFQDFSEPDRQTLADTFYALLDEELSQDCQMVDELGPSVLHVRVAITDPETSNPTLDTISSVVPQALLLSQAKGIVTGKLDFVGERASRPRPPTVRRASWSAQGSTGGSAASRSRARRPTPGTTCVRPIGIGPSSYTIGCAPSVALATARRPRPERTGPTSPA